MNGGEFDGLSVIVTGGASGIGLATARQFAARGARVAVLDLAVDTLNDSIDSGAGGDDTDNRPNRGLVGFRADISDDQSVRAAVRAAAEQFGGLDIVINNAGIGAQGTVEDFSDGEWARVLNVNVSGIARVSAAALPYLRESAHAAIVNTCSVAATSGLPQRALYSASKGAVAALTRAMATDHLADGIRVNAVSPGTADTPWVGRLLANTTDPEGERAALNDRQAIGRLISPDEVAAAILYLASPLAGSTTGVDLEVDGGLSHLRTR